MGGWNRSGRVRGHRDRRPSWPPLPPPDYGTGSSWSITALPLPLHRPLAANSQSDIFVRVKSAYGRLGQPAGSGHDKCPVPLWEREFCCYVGNISWQRFCENKHYVGPFNSLGHWDDSGALENFQNAKARFWVYYHGQLSDIPLPGADLYIDKVDHHCKVDPELVSDLEKVGLPFEDDNSAAATEADKKAAQNKSGNWDMYIEKPAEINNWGSELTPTPDTTWGVKHEPFNNNWGNGNSGWGDALANPSWHALKNHYSANKRNDFHAGSSNRYQGHAGSNNRYHDRSNMPGRKRSSGGHFQHGNSRQRNQTEGYQRSGWQDQRGRNSEWRPVNRDWQHGQGIDGGF